MTSRRTNMPIDTSTRHKTKQSDYPETASHRRSGSIKSVSPSSGYMKNDKTSPLHYSNPDFELSPSKGTAFNFPNWDSAVVVQKPRNVYIEKPTNPHVGLGFSIRGGAEHGIGIYVSYIEPNSVAERQGLEIGDQILILNGVRFQKISHEEAAVVSHLIQTFAFLATIQMLLSITLGVSGVVIPLFWSF